jgi:hypothetical protein
MTKEDGTQILQQIEDFLNTEMQAKNTITKYNATAFGQTMQSLINTIVNKYEIEAQKLRDKQNENKETVKKSATEVSGKENKPDMGKVISSNK